MSSTSRKIDPHVHTPASADYLGERGDGEYIALLKECKRADIAAIAITDHNTVNGCIALDRLRKDVRLNFELNSKRGGVKEFLDQLKEEMLLFENIAIIRAVEISVYPKIHLILCFAESVQLSDIQTFLEVDLGLGQATRSGSPDKYCTLAPTAVLEKATSKFSNDYFCILPHIDSSSGRGMNFQACPELSYSPNRRFWLCKY